MENNTGFIYRNEKGEFLLRIINRGHFDEDHYVLKFVTVFEWGCLFYSKIAIDKNDRDSLTKNQVSHFVLERGDCGLCLREGCCEW